MLERYAGESNPADSSRWCFPSTVNYLAHEERVAYVLTVKDGLIYDCLGNLFDTTDARTAQGNEGRAIFVMARDGTIYASKSHEAGMFHHSSFLAGGAIASAGEISVSNGVVAAISNISGHYRPSPNVAEQILDELWSRGVDVTAVALERM